MTINQNVTTPLIVNNTKFCRLVLVFSSECQNYREMLNIVSVFRSFRFLALSIQTLLTLNSISFLSFPHSPLPQVYLLPFLSTAIPLSTSLVPFLVSLAHHPFLLLAEVDDQVLFSSLSCRLPHKKTHTKIHRASKHYATL